MRGGFAMGWEPPVPPQADTGPVARGVWRSRWLDDTHVHVLPDDDLVIHDLTEDCVCGPQAVLAVPSNEEDDNPDLWVIEHAALDGRPGPPKGQEVLERDDA